MWRIFTVLSGYLRFFDEFSGCKFQNHSPQRTKPAIWPCKAGGFLNAKEVFIYARTRALVKQNIQRISTGAKSPLFGVIELVIAPVGIETEPSAGYHQHLCSAGDRDEGSRVFGPQQNRELFAAGALHPKGASDPPKSCRGQQAKPTGEKNSGQRGAGNALLAMSTGSSGIGHVAASNALNWYCVGEVWSSHKWAPRLKSLRRVCIPGRIVLLMCRTAGSGGGYSGRMNYV